MSGFAGLIRLDGQPLDTDCVRHFLRALPPRSGRAPLLWQDGPAAFTRCAKTEEVQASAVALSDDGRLVAHFDGRLSQRKLLIEQLGDRDLVQVSDAMLVLAAYEKLGARWLNALEGDYALVLWNRQERKLVASRSPLGWRPFHWCEYNGLRAFASEPRTLLNGLGIERRPNEGVIAEFLATRFISQTESLWQGIHVLPPGSALEWEGSRSRHWHWHDGPFEDTSELSDEDHVQRFRTLFDAALGDALDGTQASAAQLSGGLDSSTIVTRAAQLAREGRLTMPHVISMRFAGQSYDESRWSEPVVRKAGVPALALDGNGPYDWDAADAWSARSLHLPVRPNVCLPMLASEEWARLQVRVLLTGEGGDDWLSGTWSFLASDLREGRWGSLLTALATPRAAPRLKRRAGLMWRYGLKPFLTPAGRAQLALPHLRASLEVPEHVSADWARRVDLQGRWNASSPPLPAATLWGRNRYANFVMARRRMNWDGTLAMLDERDIELRHPFHDPRLIAYLLEVPGHLLLRRELRKWLLREAMRGVLPEVVRTRTCKANFSPLIADAILARVSPEGVGRLQLVQRGWIEKAPLERLLRGYADWQRAGRPASLDTQWLAAVWAVVAVDTWLGHAGVSG